MRCLSVLGRLLKSADFERVLGARPCAKSAHFAVHFLPGRPGRAGRAAGAGAGAGDGKLSTEDAPVSAQAVDEAPASAPSAPHSRPSAWLGSVVPKRHAKRAVTRNLLKRQIRAAALGQGHDATALPAGLWVVRLRAPFDRLAFPSACSQALGVAARGELAGAFERAVRSVAGAA